MAEYRHLLLLVSAMFVAACSGGEKDETSQHVETVLPDAVNEVTVIALHAADFNHELVSNGKLSARRYVDLRFEAAEPVAAIHVKNGDRVTKGQKLAELFAFRLENKVIQAKDALEKAKLELQDVLIGQGYALEDSARVPSGVMQLARTRGGYDQASAQYRLAVYEAENAALTAPFDGIVANLFARPLNVASTTDVFCTVIDPSSLEASFTVLESELPLLKTGDRVFVTPFSMPGVRTEGRITEINPMVDADGMVKVKASVVNAGSLFEGMNVRVNVQRLLGRQLIVPKEAVVLRSGKQVVFTLADGKAFWNYVQTGLENAESYTIAEGLKEGDTVITGGNINLAHESPVTIIQ
ncbi:MAG: efflux RND transporter periplasmic adaptor subunit [Tannerella sp.]|jgi:RND family efflux transporter MFP subunit|nr:efflux RND transporter periplasmic adaptor subunit [Tannerella sp.]